MSQTPHSTRPRRERILVCGVLLGDQKVEQEGELSEIIGLVAAAAGDVVGEPITQKRDRPHPATLMGKGKVQEVKDEIQAHGPDAVVVDNDLTPAQGRNLEKAWEVRVIDRSELILDIFSRRAKTRQARLQVELAQTQYVLPRLRRMWTHLERTEGAIGARGPGETQLETDKRLLRKRISDLRKQLKEIEARKLREVVSRSEQFTIGLVGYTNAGKSTLLNVLTGAEEFVADMLFAPHHLVASFHATLEETLNADLLLHVVDAAHPDAFEQVNAVDQVLARLSHVTRTGILVFNKIDRVTESIDLQFLVQDRSERIAYVSARTGEGLDRLDALVREILNARSALLRILLPLADGRLAAKVRSSGVVLEEEVLGDSELVLRVRIDEGSLGNLVRASEGSLRYEVLEPPREPLLREG